MADDKVEYTKINEERPLASKPSSEAGVQGADDSLHTQEPPMLDAPQADTVKRSSNADSRPFGNKVNALSVFTAPILRHLCALICGGSKRAINPAAVAEGEVYRDFGMLTIVDSEAVAAQGAPSPVQINPSNAVIIGTIRMGFGHWRMAIAMASAAHHAGYTPYLIDMMSFEGTQAAASIKFLEGWYNRLSRLSQRFGLFNTLIWEKATARSDISSCVRERSLSRLFMPLFKNLPRDVPLLSMHPWVGHAAVMAGMTRVVSIIPDNFPMAFWLVEGSRHTVQSPSAYMGYRTLLKMDGGHGITHCLPRGAIEETGHYVDWELVSSIGLDCDMRIARMRAGEPRRFLLTMGGAGAQAKRFFTILRECQTLTKERKAAFLVNMGDHEGRWQELKERLDASGIAYTMHSDWEDTKQFVAAAAHSIVEGVHIFLHKDFYAAVYLTNLLMHVCDIMVTKPSELSFYPIPKLFIQRVGRHEAWGAIRGSEAGDGTIETDNESDLVRTMRVLITDSDLLELYIRHIRLNAAAGVYNGAYNAVMLAMRRG